MKNNVDKWLFFRFMVIICCIVVLVWDWAEAQTLSPQIPTPSSANTPVPTTTPDLTDRVLNSADRILNFTFVMVSVIVAFAVVSGGIIVYIGNATRRARNAAKDSAKSARKNTEKIEEIGEKVQMSFANISQIGSQINATWDELRRTKKNQGTLYQISVYASRLLDDSEKTRETARNTLEQYSRDEDPIVRRECIRVFSTIPDYPEVDINRESIIRRLKELASEETEKVQAVRLDARRALAKFGIDPDADDEDGS